MPKIKLKNELNYEIHKTKITKTTKHTNNNHDKRHAKYRGKKYKLIKTNLCCKISLSVCITTEEVELVVFFLLPLLPDEVLRAHE